ncbi:MAG: hypothetical protein IJT65_03215 [Eubacterium sp.]|nr:hypothetical protein [Eubacterium sp.]
MSYYINLKINNASYAIKIPLDDTKTVFDVTSVIVSYLKPDNSIDVDSLQRILRDRFKYDISIGKIISEINYPL